MNNNGFLEEEITRITKENTFLKSFLQMHSPKMNGQHGYRWRGGWPMNRMVGNGIDEAVRNCMEEVAKAREEMKR